MSRYTCYCLFPQLTGSLSLLSLLSLSSLLKSVMALVGVQARAWGLVIPVHGWVDCMGVKVKLSSTDALEVCLVRSGIGGVFARLPQIYMTFQRDALLPGMQDMLTLKVADYSRMHACMQRGLRSQPCMVSQGTTHMGAHTQPDGRSLPKGN